MSDDDDDVIYLHPADFPQNQQSLDARPLTMEFRFEKYNCLSQSGLAEVAMTQDAMIHELQLELLKQKEQSDTKLNRLMARFKNVKEEFERFQVKSVQELVRLETATCTLKMRVEDVEFKLSETGHYDTFNVAVSKVVDSVKMGSNLARIMSEDFFPRTKKSSSTEIGIQCELYSGTTDWQSIVVQDLPTESLDSPVLRHLLDCWSSATGTFSKESMDVWSAVDEEEEQLEAFFLGSVGASTNMSCRGSSPGGAKKLLRSWISSAGGAIKGSCHVLELNNLPKELFAGFSIHLLPLLNSFGNIHISSRVREVFDFKFVARPNQIHREPTTRLAPQRSCLLCYELYFFPLTKNASTPDDWHTFNQLRVYQLCPRCADIARQPLSQWSRLYNDQLEAQRSSLVSRMIVQPSDV